MVSVVAGSSGYATRYCRSTYHAVSSISGGGCATGCGELVLVDDLLNIMLPSYRNLHCGLRTLLRRL